MASPLQALVMRSRALRLFKCNELAPVIDGYDELLQEAAESALIVT
jgi:hypothetical protein